MDETGAAMMSWGRQREVEKSKPRVQMSIAELPESQQDAAMAATERASRDYPSVNLPTKNLLHVFQMGGEGGDWEVWLNCEDADFTGICLGVGITRDLAVRDAVAVLEAALDKLQGRPW